jgi:hypothetical protein
MPARSDRTTLEGNLAEAERRIADGLKHICHQKEVIVFPSLLFCLSASDAIASPLLNNFAGRLSTDKRSKAASVVTAGFPTLAYGTYCAISPIRKISNVAA